MARLVVFLINVITWLFSLVTPRMAERIAPALARLVSVAIPRNQRVLERNLELVYPDLSETEREDLAHSCNTHYVRGVLEAGIMWHYSHERLNALFEPTIGMEFCEASQALGKGTIMAVPHWGAWEVLGLFITQELKATILYRGGKFPELEKKLVEKRMRSGAELVPAGVSGLKALYRKLKSGGVVAVLPDQDPRRGQGRFVPFMGIPALTGVVIPRLIQRSGARVIFLMTERLPGGRYRVRMQPAEEAIYSPDLEESLAALNRGVERCIALDPGQYLWAYKRYRERPPGEPPIYG